MRNHPFAVEAFFESSLVLTFAFPQEDIRHLIPECLELDTFDNKWAFIAVAVVDAKHLRPKGFPKFTGSSFFLIGYRVFVRFTCQSGKRLRGLYILKSETNKRVMGYLGNIFTHYNYSTTDIWSRRQNGITEIVSTKSDLRIEVGALCGADVLLPENSPFGSWREARRFAGPLPFTFAFKNTSSQVLVIEGVRKVWKPEAVDVKEYKANFFESIGLNDMTLASAFMVEKTPYYWKKGKVEPWRKK